uniref:Uncharacterized protein n=1 Tax=Micrurus paraensis TaxID=1970185 RepID=A0A2D4K0Q9_9SAUR
MITIKWKPNLLNNVTQNNKSSNSIYLYYKYKYVKKINFMCLSSHFFKWMWSCRESFSGEEQNICSISYCFEDFKIISGSTSCFEGRVSYVPCHTVTKYKIFEAEEKSGT